MLHPSPLTRAPVEKIYGSSIIRVASEIFYLPATERIDHVAHCFEQNPSLMAVGICDSAGQYQGIITRMQLFALLGRPFGRDILGRKTIQDSVEKVPVFAPHENLFMVARQLETDLHGARTSYYAICTAAGQFRGIFSSLDLLRFLSKMTQDDIDLAAAMQDRMMRPQATWQDEGWQAMAMLQTAKGVGGDFYYHRSISPHRHFFAMGDVSGKGVSAAIITSLLWGILRSWDFERGLKSLLLDINAALIQTFHLEKYLTGIFFIYDSQKRSLRFADMGHGHAGLVRKGKIGALQLPHLNLPLGIETELDPKIFRFELRPGDLLYAWSDGICEQENNSGIEFGQERLDSLIIESLNHAEEIPQRLHQAVHDWRAGFPQHDDMTWLQIKIL